MVHPERITTASPTTATAQTPPGRGGIAVILLSGPRTEAVLAELFRPLPSHKFTQEGQLQLGHITDPRDGRTVDQALVCPLPGRAEINIHGGPAAAAAVLELLSKQEVTVSPAPVADRSLPAAHLRWNNPAVGREMLQVLVNARSPLVLAAVSRQWSSGISALASQPDPKPEPLRSAAKGLTTMQRLLSPAEVVLAGPPNAGKSSLANLLVGREVSITHEQAGTTRDWVRETAVLDGVPVFITDTAGIWAPPHPVDAEAVRRARQRVRQAELVVLLAEQPLNELPPWCPAERVLPVLSKCDLQVASRRQRLAISTVTGEGLDSLRQEILRRLGLDSFDASAPRAFTPRQAVLLNGAADALERQERPRAAELLQQFLRGEVRAVPA